MNPEEMFDAKALEVQEWAIANGLLGPAQRVVITIEKVKPVISNRSPGRQPNRKWASETNKIRQEDWDLLISSARHELSGKIRRFLTDLRANNNQPMHLPKGDFDMRRGQINQELSRLQLPFRLLVPNRHPTYGGVGPVTLWRSLSN